MDYKKYERILNNIVHQAPLECGVQALVYMLLDEVISQQYTDGEIRVIVADLRNNASVFGGKGGVPDLCIVDKEFIFVDKKVNAEEMVVQKKHRRGCVEVKAVKNVLRKRVKQLAGHIIEYGNVLYTNGLIWEYYCPTDLQIQDIQTVLDGEKEKKIIDSKIVERLQVILQNILENEKKDWPIHIGKKGAKESDVFIIKSEFEKLEIKLAEINWENNRFKK